MLADIINYVPDPKNGRPVADGKVFFFVENYVAPGNSADVDETKIAQVYYRANDNTVVVPQPIYTTQGGTLKVGSLTYRPELFVAETVRLVAVYDKCGKLLYQAEFRNGCCTQIGGDLGLVTEPTQQFVDFDSVAEPATCFQDLGFLPSILNIETQVFDSTFASLVAGVLTLPFNYTLGTNSLDVFVNGSLVSDYAETTVNSITFTADIIAAVTTDTAIRIKYRYVQLN